jgi:hypothetical protein
VPTPRFKIFYIYFLISKSAADFSLAQNLLNYLIQKKRSALFSGFSLKRQKSCQPAAQQPDGTRDRYRNYPEVVTP